MDEKEKLKRDSCCRLCGKQTATVFNINLKPVHVCDECALTITKQEVVSWTEKKHVFKAWGDGDICIECGMHVRNTDVHFVGEEYYQRETLNNGRKND